MRTEAISFLVGEREQTVELGSINTFLNQFGIWEMTKTAEDSRFLVASIERGLLAKKIRIPETEQGIESLKEFLSIYDREKMPSLGNPEVIEIVTKEFLVRNFMKIRTNQLLELAQDVERISVQREKRQAASITGT